MCAQAFNVGDQIPGGVFLQAGMGSALAAATLIEQDDAIALWIEEAPHVCIRTATGAAMQEDDGLALGIAALFEIQFMQRGDAQLAGSIGSQRWIKAIHGSSG